MGSVHETDSIPFCAVTPDKPLSQLIGFLRARRLHGHRLGQTEGDDADLHVPSDHRPLLQIAIRPSARSMFDSR